MKTKVNKGHKRSDPNHYLTKSYAVWLVIVVLIIAIMALIFVPGQPGYWRNKAAIEKSSRKSIIAFRADGELSFVNKEGKLLTKINIEIARNEDEHMRGLMYRSSIPHDAGMLFKYDNEELRLFWMKNTYISLDIIFADKNKRIVTIRRFTEPLSIASISSNSPAQYVLEVNAGFTQKYGIHEGDRLEF